MTVQEFYDHLTKHMTPEQALMKLLEGQVMEYEKLKFSQEETAIHPVLLIAMAALEMGWNLAIPNGNDDDELIGMAVGTEEYLNDLFKFDSCGGGECTCNHDHPDKEEN